MIPATTPLVRFSREIIWSLGQISLLVKIGDEEHSTLAWMNFMDVRSPSPYNGIIRRPGVRRIQAVPFTTYGMLKFPVAGETVTLWSSRIIPLECTMVSGPGVPQPVINQVTEEKIQRPPAFLLLCRFLYFYQVLALISFAQRNARATYQCLVDKAFKKQIGRNLEVYVDDLVIKIRTEKEVIRDIEETFKTLKEINMKLNPKKYAFRMREGTFLGYKVDADKLRKCLKKSDFQWTAEAEMIFKKMKKLIAELLMLTTPKAKEELIMYLAAAREPISAVLMHKGTGSK
nr:hypothetical protein [Tanacetum cinerariifolium]